MAKTRAQKSATIDQLGQKLSTMKALVFTSFVGLSVKDATELRTQLRAQQIDVLVSKKSLLRRSLKDAGMDAGIVDNMAGGLALVFGYEDEVLPAKLLSAFAKTHPAVELLGGLVNGAYLGAPEIKALAKLPGREELIAQTVWTIKAPLTGLVNVLSGNIRSLVTVLQAIKDKQPAA